MDLVTPTMRPSYEHAELAGCYILGEPLEDVHSKNAILRA